MFLPFALFASAVLLQQTPSAAQTAAPAPATAPAEASQSGPTTLPPVNVDAAPAEPTQVCRTEPVTGSRFGRRVCRSTAQTDEDRANSREMLRQMQGARTPPAG